MDSNEKINSFSHINPAQKDTSDNIAASAATSHSLSLSVNLITLADPAHSFLISVDSMTTLADPAHSTTSTPLSKSQSKVDLAKTKTPSHKTDPTKKVDSVKVSSSCMHKTSSNRKTLGILMLCC